MIKLSEMLDLYPINSEWMVTLHDGALKVRCKVVDLRHTFGRIDAEVTPTHGKGTTWVDASKMERIE